MAKRVAIVPGEQMLTVPEVAARARVGRATVYRWIAAGLLDRVDVGAGRAKTRIPESALARYFEARSVAGRRAA